MNYGNSTTKNYLKQKEINKYLLLQKLKRTKLKLK